MADEKISLGDLINEKPKAKQTERVSLGDLINEKPKAKQTEKVINVSPVKKKEPAQPSTGSLGFSQYLQEKPTSTQIPFRQGAEVDQPKLKVNRVNVINRADAGEVNPDLNELADLNQRLIKGGVFTPGEIERKELDKGDIDDFTLRTRVVRDLREKSIQKSKQLEVGAKKLQQQGQALIQQYEQAPSPELKSQIEQLDKDYQLTVNEYNKERFKQDHYEKRLVQTSDSIKRLANEQLPDDFFSGFYKGLKGNVGSWSEAIDLAKKSKKEQIEYAKTKALQAPTKETQFSAQVGEMIGGVAPDVGAVIGFSLAGLPAAGATVVAVRQGAQQAADDFVRAFNQAKEQGVETGELDRNGRPILREATDDEAYDIATKAAGVGFGTGALEGLAGSVTGGLGGKLAGRATTTVGRVLTERAVDVGLDAGIAGTMQTGRNLFDRAQGLQTSVGEGVLQNMAGEVLLSAPVNVVAGRKEIAKAKKASEEAKSQLFESVVNAKDNPEELKKLTENLEIIKNQGLVTESEYNDIVKKAQQYQEALPTIPEEIKNKKAAADLIIERNDLAEKAQTVDEAYKKPIEERIKQINEELLKVDEKAITPPPAAEVTLPEVEVVAEKPAPTEPIEAQKVEVKEEPKEVVTESLKDVESTAKALEEVSSNKFKYTGKLGKTKANERGITYLTSDRGYASFYESGVEKPINSALEELNNLKPPIKPQKVELSSKEEIDYMKSIGEPLTPFNNIYQTDKEVQDKNKLLEEDYQKSLKEYENKKNKLKKEASDYLSPTFLYGKFMNLNIDFSKDSQQDIFKKLKSKGITKEFKGGNFLDNYESDLKEYAAKNGIDYYNGIKGGIKGSMNISPDEIILINKDKAVLKSELSEAYHKAKADGSNPELVKAVEDLLGKPKAEAKPAEEVVVKEEEGKKRVYRAEQIANTLGGEVVGSATRKGAIPNDFDIYIENKIDFQSMKNKMESLGYKSIGASPVVDTSGKPFAGENQTAFHFINNKGQKVDVFQEETSEDYFKRVSKPTEVTAEATPIEEVVDKTSEQISKEQTIETEMLLAGEAVKRRNEGRFVKDGIEFVRNEKIEGSKGESGLVRFTSEPGGKGVVMPFKYKLVEAETLQPSHQNGLRNPNNFIPEAQPKNRNDKASLSAEDGFAQKPRFNELGKSEYPYNGAPVVNERNEVIQGNNRAAGLKRGYSQKTHNYKQDLLNNAEQFGFTKEQVEGIKNPILVREVSVSDNGAIELGNYDVKDLETGGKRRIDPIATTRRLPFDIKGRLSEIIFRGEETLNQSIRNNKKAIIELLSPFLNQSQKNTILDNGELTESGIQDLESVFKHFLFDGGDVALPELFESLSYNQREGLRKSLPYIFSTGFEKSIIPEVQEAIIILNHYNASGIGEFKKWLSQSDMFNDSRTPKDIYTPTALEIARILNDAKSQKEIIGLPDPKRGLEASNFAKYSSLVKSTPSTIFEEATSGMSKKEAIKQTFNTEYDEKTESTITKGGDREIGTEPTKKAEPTAETKTTDVTPVEQTTFDMIVDEKGNKKYKNREEAMADYEKNKLSEYGETFEEFLQRILCP